MMLRKFFITLSAVLLLAVPAVLAQPAWVKKTTKSVFTLKTFAPDGTLLGGSTGFFVGEDGTALSSFTPFKGAQRAVVIDATGKEYAVVCMLGANETYDVAKFRVDVKKSQPLPLVASELSEGSGVWMLPYREVKQVPAGHIAKTEAFNGDYAYYTVEMNMPDNAASAPLLNEAGEVVGLMQKPSAPGRNQSYAVSARFANSVHISGLSLNDPALRSTYIKKALPAEFDQAQLMLYVAAQSADSLSYAQMVDDFISQFPNRHEGYVYKAQLAASVKDYAAADQEIAKALKVAAKPDEVHFSYSRMIYQKNVYDVQTPYAAWTLDKALTEVSEAERLNPQPGYQQHKAYVLFAQQKYGEAYEVYARLFESSLRSAEVFYEASRCKEMLADTASRLALLDSAVAMFSRPYLREAAPYLIARAQASMQAGKNRQAVNDLNDYENLMKAQLNDNFYYLRHQAEVAGRLFQQALDDIDRAIEMNPDYDLYYAEKASLQVRVGLYDDAINTSRRCIELSPQYSDGYLFLGLAQCLKGEKTEGVKNLQQARQLGDPQADGLIKKYSK